MVSRRQRHSQPKVDLRLPLVSAIAICKELREKGIRCTAFKDAENTSFISINKKDYNHPAVQELVNNDLLVSKVNNEPV